MTHNPFTPALGAVRFYQDGTESGSTPYAAQDTNYTLTVTANTKFHYRAVLTETGGNTSGATTDDWQIQYSKNSGAYTNITGSSSNIRATTSASVSDGGATTDRATNGLTNPVGQTFQAGIIEASDGVIADYQLNSNQFTELLYVLEVVYADVANNDTFDFRVTFNGGTPGMGISTTLRLTISKANNKTITAEGGSYAISGTAASLELGRVLTAAAGSYLLSGTAAALTAGSVLAAGAGSYTLSGTDAALDRTYVLAAEAASYSISGSAASLLHDFIITADGASYVVTGADASLLTGATLTAESGSYAVSGTDSALLLTQSIAAESTTYTFTGTDATLAQGQRVSAEGGSYALTGTAASLLAGFEVVAGSGAYALTGNAASVLHGWVLEHDAGSGSLVYVGGASGGAIDGANVTISLTSLTGGIASAPSEGDLVLVFGGHSYSSSSTGAGVTNSGYSTPDRVTSNSHAVAETHKFMGVTPDTSVTGIGPSAAGSSFPGTHVATYVVHVWRNVDPSTPLDAATVKVHQDSINPNPSAITTVTDGAVVLTGVLKQTPSGVTGPTPPSGYGNLVNVSANDTIGDETAAMASKLVATAGAEDPGTWTNYADQRSTHLYTMALRPGAGGTANVYELTGADASFISGFVITAGAGSYVLTGSDVDLIYAPSGLTLTAEAGTYTLSGTDASLLLTQSLIAEAGSYALTGSDANFTIAAPATLVAEAGSYALTGTDASVLIGFVVSAAGGTYSLTGADADFNLGYSIVAEGGSYLLSGSAVTITFTRLVEAESGSYELSGSEITLLYKGYVDKDSTADPTYTDKDPSVADFYVDKDPADPDPYTDKDGV